MEASHQSIHVEINGIDYITEKQLKSHAGTHLAVALGIIVLIGSLVATGCLFSALGYPAFAIGGAGIAFAIACFILSSCCKTEVTITKPPHQTQSDPLLTEPEIPNLPLERFDNPTDTNTPEERPVSPFNLEFLPPSDPRFDDPILQTPSSTPEPKPLAPLPFLLDIEIEAPNPLNKPLETKYLVKPGFRSTFLLNQLLFAPDATPEQIFGNPAIDSELLNISLSFWINPDTNDFDAENMRRIMNDPARAQQKQIIDERIKALDKAIQLTERLERRPYVFLQIKDLLPAWVDSPLRYQLMMDDELTQLTIASASNFKIPQWLLKHIQILAKKESAFIPPPYTTYEQMQAVRLVDLPKFTAELINACPTHFPPVAFLLIPPSELQKIDLSQLTENQLHLLFTEQFVKEISFHYYSVLLTPQQINACIGIIQDKKLFTHLSIEQIAKIDEILLDQEIFNVIFQRPDSILPKLLLEKIYKLMHFFTQDHWKYLGNEHSLAFDFSKIEEPKRQAAFNIVFDADGNYSQAAKLLPRLKLDRIYTLIRFFGDNHWKYLGNEHSLAFDFSKIEEPKRQAAFNIVFDADGNYSQAAKLLPRLKLDRIYTLIRFFGDNHWKYLGNEHSLAFDFSKIEEPKRQAAFNIVFDAAGNYSQAAKLLPRLKLDRIYTLTRFFGDNHWEHLGREHSLAFDFSKIEESKRQTAFNIVFEGGGNYSKAAQLLPQLTIEHIYTLISFFGEDHWKYLGKAHTLAFDFSKVEEPKRQAAFNIVFEAGGNYSKAAQLLPLLTPTQVAQVRDYLAPEAQKYLKV